MYTVPETSEIKYTGLREGEKLYEELITEGEGIVDTHHDKIMVLRGNDFISCDRLHQYLERLADDSRAHDGLAIQETLKAVIPEYTRSGFDTWNESGVGWHLYMQAVV